MGCSPEAERLDPVVRVQPRPFRALSYFFLGLAFFPFAGFAAGLSVYSSGWWRLQVLHMSIASLPLLSHCYTRLYQPVRSSDSLGSRRSTAIRAQPGPIVHPLLTTGGSTWPALLQSGLEPQYVTLSGLPSKCPREHHNLHKNRPSFHQ